MRYVIITPHNRMVLAADYENLHDAERAAGLDPDEVDHGTIVRGLGYVVHEFSLFTPPAEQSYFGIAGRLIAGPAVLYGFDEAGETIDLKRSEIPDVRFFLGVNDVEFAIETGEIVRPQMSVNGVTTWQWPQPRER